MLPISLAAHVAAFGAAWVVSVARPAASAPAVATLTGETFAPPRVEDEVAVEGDTAPPGAVAPAHAVAPAPPAAAAAPVDPDAPGRRPAVVARTTSAARTPATLAASAAVPGGGAAAPALYGAVGDRSAAELGRAFTRAFPQAASTDPQWASAPLGDAGAATLVVVLDDNGKIEETRIEGAPSAALRAGIARTLQLVKARTFVARQKTTRIALHARVSADEIHDGWHGDVFAIGASEGGDSAFFALAIGRRVDVNVTIR